MAAQCGGCLSERHGQTFFLVWGGNGRGVLIRLRLLMTSVLSEMGRARSWSLRNRPQALHSTEPMVLSDARLPDYPMVVVNDAFAALTGYPRSESVGRNCRFLQGAGTDQETARRIGRTIVAGRGCIEWIVNHRKDGEAFTNLLPGEVKVG